MDGNAVQYTKENYTRLNDRDFEYYMQHHNRGVAYIINNDKFTKQSGMSDRKGSSYDRESLYYSLQAVGFRDIHPMNNLTTSSMIQVMKEASMIDYTNKDCLFVAILSHGDDKTIYGIDQPISYDNLMKPFKSSHVAPHVGKPKIFLIQACEQDTTGNVQFCTDTGPTRREMISTDADIILAYSVIPGMLRSLPYVIFVTFCLDNKLLFHLLVGSYAWANEEVGSWFIQAFCEVLRNDGRRLHFEAILARTNRLLSVTYETATQHETSSSKKPSPCVISTLTKSIYFR